MYLLPALRPTTRCWRALTPPAPRRSSSSAAGRTWRLRRAPPPSGPNSFHLGEHGARQKNTVRARRVAITIQTAGQRKPMHGKKMLNQKNNDAGGVDENVTSFDAQQNNTPCCPCAFCFLSVRFEKCAHCERHAALALYPRDETRPLLFWVHLLESKSRPQRVLGSREDKGAMWGRGGRSLTGACSKAASDVCVLVDRAGSPLRAGMSNVQRDGAAS